MRHERPALLLIGVLSIAAVGLGLYTTGGPGAGRMERHDRIRESDLTKLSHYMRCVADANGKTLPAALTRSEACNADTRFDDPFTGAPYRYEKVSDTGFRLCTSFERPEMIRRLGSAGVSFEGATGCFLYAYRR